MAKKLNIEEDDSLLDVLKSINKSYGEGSVMYLGESALADIEVISSGSIMLDNALGVGGYPRGRIVEIYGPESSGKTTLAIHAVAEAQRKGLKALYVDTENAFDKEYAARLGVDVNKLLFTQPSCGEEALEIADRLIKTGKIGIAVIDSVATLTPKAEVEGEMGDNKVGLQARLMSQALRKMTATIKSTNCLCIFINQLREKIGVMFGNPETTSGGNALKFYASQRLDIRKVTTLKDGEEAVANQVRVKVIKNKVAPPFKKAEFEIEFGKGINTLGEVLDAAIEFDIIHRSGSWFSYEDAKIAQGKDNVRSLMTENKEFFEEVKKKVQDYLKNQNVGLFDTDSILDE